MPFDKSIKKVLVIGSGPIVIGQAAEFDYAGAQACRVLKSEGVDVVLINSNPATIMTDSALADEIYLEPLTAATVKRIIDKEKPDSLLAGLGGQTALTIAMQLDKEGFLQSRGVRLIGTNAKAIDRAEDRQLFKSMMEKIGRACHSVRYCMYCFAGVRYSRQNRLSRNRAPCVLLSAAPEEASQTTGQSLRWLRLPVLKRHPLLST